MAEKLRGAEGRERHPSCTQPLDAMRNRRWLHVDPLEPLDQLREGWKSGVVKKSLVGNSQTDKSELLRFVGTETSKLLVNKMFCNSEVVP